MLDKCNNFIAVYNSFLEITPLNTYCYIQRKHVPIIKIYTFNSVVHDCVLKAFDVCTIIMTKVG